MVELSEASLPGESIDDQKVAHDASDSDGEDYGTYNVVCMIRDVYCGEQLRGLMHHTNLQTQTGDGTVNYSFIMIICVDKPIKILKSPNESLLVPIHACIWTQALTYSEGNSIDICWSLIFSTLSSLQLK